MNDKPRECAGCPLHELGEGFALTAGNGATTGVLVVAEALGEHEARKGEPLVGPAGQTWDRIVGRTKCPELGRALGRDDFLLANVINCRPPNNVLAGAPYEFPAIAHCAPYLAAVVSKFRPRAILALGGTALRTLTGEHGIEQLRGYIFDSTRFPGIPVVGTYHPSYIMRGKWNLARVVQMDILRAIDVARKGAKSFLQPKHYILSANWGDAVDFFEEWRKAGRPPLSFDIETPKAGEAADNEEMTFEADPSYEILMCSFAWKGFHAISLPWQEPFISLMKKAFAEQGTSFNVWHAAFDVPRLIANGAHFGSRIYDAMLAWHWLEPALPMGLKYVATFFCPDMHAWKLGMHQNFQWYNAADSDVLCRVFAGTKERLEQQGRWRTFERHFGDFGEILTRMTERGVTIDHAARGKAREHFQRRFSEVVDRGRGLAPQPILRVHPKRGYKKTPKSTEGLVQIEVELTGEEAAAFRKEQERARKKREEERAKLERKRERERKKAEAVAAKAAKAAARTKRELPEAG